MGNLEIFKLRTKSFGKTLSYKVLGRNVFIQNFSKLMNYACETVKPKIQWKNIVLFARSLNKPCFTAAKKMSRSDFFSFSCQFLFHPLSKKRTLKGIAYFTLTIFSAFVHMQNNISLKSTSKAPAEVI